MVSKVKNLKRRGFMFILSSPSGAGKTTLARMLMKKDDGLVISTSYTTRAKRAGEVDGKDYYFVNEKQFQKHIDEGFFLEHAKVFQNFYGTPKHFVFNHLNNGEDVLFDIDWQGTEQIKSKYREQVASIFILPPSMAELERRLRARNNDSEQIIEHRMSKANFEISHYNSYDFVIVNDNLEESLAKIYAILTAERLKRVRQNNLSDFVDGLINNKVV